MNDLGSVSDSAAVTKKKRGVLEPLIDEPEGIDGRKNPTRDFKTSTIPPIIGFYTYI